MKKHKFSILISLVLATIVSLGITSTVVAKTSTENITVHYKGIKIFMDSNELPISNEPFLFKSTTYMPIRDIAEALGKEVSWKSETKTVILTTPDNQIVTIAPAIARENKLGSEEIVANYSDIKIIADGRELSSETNFEPFIYNGTTYLPLRKVAQAFGMDVNWDAKNQCIHLGEYPKKEVATVKSTFKGLTYDVPAYWTEIDYGNYKVYNYDSAIVLLQYVEGARAADINKVLYGSRTFSAFYKEINYFPNLWIPQLGKYVSKDNLNYLAFDLKGHDSFMGGSILCYHKMYLADANEGIVIAIYITSGIADIDLDIPYEFADMMENARAVVVDTKKINWATERLEHFAKQSFFLQFH